MIRILAAILLLAGLACCQSYAPKLLNSASHVAETKVQLINAWLAQAQAAFRFQELLGSDLRVTEMESQP